MCIRDSGNGASHTTQSTSQSVSKPKIRPIVIPDNRNYREILRSLQNLLPSAKLEARCQGASLRIAATTVPDFRSVQQFLTDRKISFHTFALPSEREIKVVLSGLPSWTAPDTIRQELVALGYSPTAVSVLPVSYTHLDVYKRQLLSCHIFLLCRDN